ncbi:MAG TPA: glycosyl hydrolase family 18 protein [Candidatus Woesebacteria bacterium]|nr:glycosyl hydrolase family 18 protein [Candidatus Woesebacteria bacterium]
MKFGFQTYHKSLLGYISSPNRIYTFIFLIFLSITVSISISYLQSSEFTVISFAKDKTPIADNYSAPLAQTKSFTNDRKQVIGFLPSWSIAAGTKLYPEYMDQIIYFGIAMDEEGNIIKKDTQNNPLVEWNYINSDYFTDLQTRTKETNTKVTVAVRQFDNNKIYTLITNESYTNNAANQLATFVSEYKLDGINIDFEYFSPSDEPTLQFYNRFVETVTQKIREANPNSLISIDVNATVVYNDNAYDMVKIGDIVDQIIIMGYDYHTPASYYAGPISPIDMKGDKPSIRKTIKSLEGRVHKDKIILGIPFYGYEWQTETKDRFSKVIPNTGATATYARVRELIAGRNDVSLDFDETTLSPRLTYMHNGLIKQIYYEDERSLLEKIKFVELNGLDGIAIWALGYEGEYVEPWNIIKEHVRGKN